jgi:regulator of sirC expression with transglutaminase-like and TPR domain
VRVDFSEFCALPDDRLDLLFGTVLIARDSYPGLTFAEQSQRFDELAAPLIRERLCDLPVTDRCARLAEYLYGECGFRGNTDDFHDPRNSFINVVLDRRLGIPISLAVVYMEVARRCGVSVNGVGFPGHFLVRLDDPVRNEALLADPFGGGIALDRTALQRLLSQTGTPKKLDSSMLLPASTRQILGRMLMNLRGIYATRGDYPRLLLVLDRMIDLMPDVANELRDRGLLWAKLGAPQAALDDLRRYAESLPHAGDVAEIRRLISQLEQGSAAPN